MATIRLANAADAPEIADIYGSIVKDTPISFEAEAPDGTEIERRITTILSHAPWLVCAHRGEVVGYAYASKHHERAAYRWSVDVSVYIRERERQRAVGRALYTSLFSVLGLQGFYSAHAGITLPNVASVGLHESLGFRSVGVYRAVGFKLGSWHDVGWWQLALRERAGVPKPPLRMSELSTTSDWERTLAAGLPLLRL